MRRITAIAILMVVGVVGGLAPMSVGAEAQAPDDTGRFTVTPEFLYWTRTRGANAPINVVGPGDVPSPGESFYDFSDLDLTGWRPGGGLTVAYRLDEMTQVWARGFFVGQFGDSQTKCMMPGCAESGGTSTTFSIEPGNATTTNNTLSGFTAFTSNPSSSVWGLEANYDRALLTGPGLRLRAFGGPRFIQFSDRIKSLFFEDPNDLAGTDDETQSVKIEEINNLVGGQVGLDLRQPLISTLFLDGRVAGGLFANVVKRQRQFQEFEAGSTYRSDDDLTKTRFAQAVEASLLLSWQFLQNWTASVGYQMLLLNDVSVAPSQFQTVAVPNDDDPRASSNVIFHGVVVRMGVRF